MEPAHNAHACRLMGASSPACDRRRRRAPGIFERLNLQTGVSGIRASTPTLLLLELTRFSRQFPLLSCLMIVRLCHNVLLG